MRSDVPAPEPSFLLRKLNRFAGIVSERLPADRIETVAVQRDVPANVSQNPHAVAGGVDNPIPA